MAGIFQQNVGGGDTVFSSQQGVQDDSAAKLLAYVGEQSIEANRGYNDAKLEHETKDVIEGYLANKYIQFAGGQNPDLQDLSNEYKKYRNAYDQGIMTSAQMEVRVMAARKAAVNRMPGRINEINALSAQTVGQYQEVLNEAAAREKASTKSNEWAEKQTRTSFEKAGVPGYIAYNQPIQQTLQEYGPLLDQYYKQENDNRRYTAGMKQNDYTKQEAVKSSGQAILTESTSMEPVFLNIASSITGKRINSLQDIPEELWGQVEAQHRQMLDQKRNMYDGNYTGAGYDKFNTEWDSSVMPQAENMYKTMKGEFDTEAWTTMNAREQTKAEYRARSIPGYNEAAYVANDVGKNMPPEQQLAIMKIMRTEAMDQYLSGKGTDSFTNPKQVSDGVTVTKELTSQANMSPEDDQTVTQYLTNLATGVTVIESGQNIKDISTMLANPQSTTNLRKNAEQVAAVTTQMSTKFAKPMATAMQDRNQQLIQDGDNFYFVGGTPQQDREMNLAYSTVLKNLNYVNNNVAYSPEFQTLMNAVVTPMDTGDDNDTNNKPPEPKGRPPTDEEYAKFEKAVTRVIDNPDYLPDFKNKLIKQLIEGQQKKGISIQGAGSLK